jgi:hypothetical protein
MGRMTNQSTMEPKAGGSFGGGAPGSGSMLYGPNLSFSGPNYPPPPGFHQPNAPLYKSQPSNKTG